MSTAPTRNASTNAATVVITSVHGNRRRGLVLAVLLALVVAIVAFAVGPNGVDILTLPVNSQVGSPFLGAIAGLASRNGVEVETVRKFSQGPGPAGEPTIVQLIMDGRIDLIFNTPHGLSPDGRPRFDGYEIRTAAVLRNIPCVTTVQGLAAAVQGIEAVMAGNVGVRSLQSWAQLA